MKRLMTLVMLSFTTWLLAQNQRFVYEYRWVQDSTSKEKISEETMYLDISPKGSKYYSYEKYKSDSIVEAQIQKQFATKSADIRIDMSGIKVGKVGYIVEKTYPDFEIQFFNSISSDKYLVKENLKINWEILPDKEKIGEFDAQKAKTQLWGRTWYAWFTTEIPVVDGPYKFHGLPGLIVKVEDATGSHKMELKASKSLVKDQEWKSEAEQSGSEKYIPINREQYKKLFWEYRKDPVKSLRMMYQSGATMSVKDASGNPIDMNEFIRKREIQAKESIKRNNNLIELDLLTP